MSDRPFKSLTDLEFQVLFQAVFDVPVPADHNYLNDEPSPTITLKKKVAIEQMYRDGPIIPLDREEEKEEE